MRYVGNIKNATRIVIDVKHELTHVLIGLIYAWFLREVWGEFNLRYIWWAVFASLLPDIDHLIFFFFYGRRDPYSQQVKKLLKDGQIYSLIAYLSKSHKQNTNLWSHNIYIILILLTGGMVSYRLDIRMGVVLFGAMALHFIYDIIEDLLVLRGINPNWKRWGRGKSM